MAAVEIDGPTIVVLIGAFGAVFVLLNKLADHIIIPMAKDWWAQRAAQRAEKEAEEAKKRGEEPDKKPTDPHVCLLGHGDRLQHLDKTFANLNAIDPHTGLPRYYAPPDWKDRMDALDAAIAVVHSEIKHICAKHDTCNAGQSKIVTDLRKENERLNERVDTLQEARLAEAREAGDRLLDFATKIERGVNGKRTGSRRTVAVDSGHSPEEDEELHGDGEPEGEE
jgi:hypothetical protein